MLPIVSSTGSIGNNNITYKFADATSIDFTYNFKRDDSTVDSLTGLGYFNTNYIAAPQYACNGANKNNAFSGDFPNWLSTINASIDLRGFYVKCSSDGQSYIRLVPDMLEVLGTISSYTKTPVAYTTEALAYAQSGYFVTVVMVQWSNVFACKSRKVIFSFYNIVFFDLFRS